MSTARYNDRTKNRHRHRYRSSSERSNHAYRTSRSRSHHRYSSSKYYRDRSRSRNRYRRRYDRRHSRSPYRLCIRSYSPKKSDHIIKSTNSNDFDNCAPNSKSTSTNRVGNQQQSKNTQINSINAISENDKQSTRQKKRWKEWEDKIIVSERDKIIKNSNKKIQKITEKDWKNIASKLETETKKRIACDKGRSWNSVKARFNNKISKNVKYFNNKENECIQIANPNIREKLQNKLSYRGTFRGEFQRFGDDKGKRKSTKRKKKYICLSNIRSSNNLNEILCNHVWLNVGKQINDLGRLKKQVTIEFDARIEKYRKGSIKRGIKVQYDYKFTNPSKVKLHKPLNKVSKTVQKHQKNDIGTNNNRPKNERNNVRNDVGQDAKSKNIQKRANKIVQKLNKIISENKMNVLNIERNHIAQRRKRFSRWQTKMRL